LYELICLQPSLFLLILLRSPSEMQFGECEANETLCNYVEKKQCLLFYVTVGLGHESNGSDAYLIRLV